MNIIKPKLEYHEVSRVLLFVSILVGITYYIWWWDLDHVANVYLYSLLLFSESFHVFMSLGLFVTLWGRDRKFVFDNSILDENFPINVFITVCGEPEEIVRKTIEAAKNLDYLNKSIYVLNDGKGAKKENWQQIDLLAKEMGVNCITREESMGFKAANLNNALKQTSGIYFIVLDADMEIYPDFIIKTLPYMRDEKMGFVQTPQYYKNHSKNQVTAGSWEQQEIFFGMIMKNKNNYDSSFLAGTNFLMRRKAIEDIGLFYEKSIAEDFVSSMLIHNKGYKSYYTTEILSQGLAPEDLLAYNRQQARWCRGSLQTLFIDNPLFKKGLTWNQKFQYLLSAFFYLNGLIVLLDMIMPLIFFYSGLKPVASTTASFALLFIPYMFCNLLVIYIASGASITFRSISFIQSSFFLQIRGLLSIIFRQNMKFLVTPKQARKNNYLFLAYPHLLYLGVGVLGIFYRIGSEGLDSSVATNISWFLMNCILFYSFVSSAFPWKKEFSAS